MKSRQYYLKLVGNLLLGVTKLIKTCLIEVCHVHRAKKIYSERTLSTETDPKRPWRTHSNKERLLRINNELKHHHDKGSQKICPLDESTMKNLVQECEEEAQVASKIPASKLRETIDEAKKNLPNFQYRKIDNTTATMILPTAHNTENTGNDTDILATESI